MPAHSADYDARSPTHPGNGNTFTSGAQMATRRMKSADHLSGDYKWDQTVDNSTLLPPYAPEPQGGSANPADMRARSPNKGRSDSGQLEGPAGKMDDDSKWIHRDKLAKIESEELQAAGLFVPRSRAPSKQRRDRSRSNMRRGTDASEQVQTRSRKNSSAVEHRAPETAVPSWDLRTPEEIAEEEANAYFTNNGLGTTSRIPVAKTSPAPISLDYIERGSPATRRQSESPDGDPSLAKTRSRSNSASLRGLEKPNGTLHAKRSHTDISPKKPPTSRKQSSAAKSAALHRPKTRSGSNGGTRPSTRSGESPPTKQPEGDPPWMANSYKPDPRLPPDQQLIPTVARRLQQEKWEKEGTFGDVYDKEFRPLNDKSLLKPPTSETTPAAAEDNQQEQSPAGGEWPLRAETKSPSIRQGAYSTMPKISDKQHVATPAASPLHPPPTPQMFQPQLEPQSPAAQRVPGEKEDADGKKKEGGCGCCVVM